MWKTVALSAALFASAALGLLAGARFVESSALSAIGAIGLCLVGIVLILIAPPREDAEVTARAAHVETPITQPAPALDAASLRSAPHIAAATGPHSTLP